LRASIINTGIDKKAFGYRNKDRFKNDILFHCGGLDLYPEMAYENDPPFPVERNSFSSL